MKFYPYLFMLLCIAFLQSSCGGDTRTPEANGTADSSTAFNDTSQMGAKESAALSGDFGSPCKILYIKNFSAGTGDNQLEKLISPSGATVGKIVFQIFHNAANGLTLSASPGVKGRGQFERFSFRPILEVSSEVTNPSVDLKGKDVFMPQLELADTIIRGRNFFAELKAVVNVPGKEYITFSPRLAVASDRTKFHLLFDIGYWSAAQVEQEGLSRTPPTSLGLDLNPSPPRSAF